MSTSAADPRPLDDGERGAIGVAAMLEGLDPLRRLMARRMVRRGDRLLVEDDSAAELLILAEGWAVVYRTTVDGHRPILDFALPGDILGAITSGRAPHAADMVSDGLVLAIPRRLVVEAARTRPELALALCARMEEVVRRAHDRIVIGACRSARPRVCRLIVELIHRLEPRPADSAPLEIAFPLRQQHIADALGLRTETACRVLVALRRQGIATLRRGRLRVTDLQRLGQACGADDDDDDRSARRLVDRVLPDRDGGPRLSGA